MLRLGGGVRSSGGLRTQLVGGLADLVVVAIECDELWMCFAVSGLAVEVAADAVLAAAAMHSAD